MTTGAVDGTGLMGKALAKRNGARHLHIVLLMAAALLILTPQLIFGYPDGHSAKYNTTWLYFFSQQLAGGNVYPRWLVDDSFGLGSPVFYFYAPAPFYLAASIKSLCLGCGVIEALTLTHWVLLAGSGCAFYAWLRPLAKPAIRLIGALLYMAAPYHLLDLEIRTALGEVSAYLWLPLLFMALDRISASRTGIANVALVYTGLILSHLPSAMLAAPVMALYTLLKNHPKERRRALTGLVAAGLMGACIASLYILPAVYMQSFLLEDAWTAASGPQYLPQNFLIFSGAPLQPFSLIVYRSLACLSGVALAITIAPLAWRKLNYQTYPKITDIRVVSIFIILLCWVMMTAISAFLWQSLAPLQFVQFPWRLGVIIEFFALTAAIAALSPLIGNAASRRKHVKFFRATAIGLLFASIVLPNSANFDIFKSFYTQRAWTEYDVSRSWTPVEYRPPTAVESSSYRAGMRDTANTDDIRLQHDAGFERLLSRISAYEDIQLGRSAAPGERLTILKAGPASFEIDATLTQPGTVNVRRFYFPTWKLTNASTGDEIPLDATPGEGLISFPLGVGEHRLSLSITPHPIEYAGLAISIASVLVVFALFWLDRGGKKR